MKDFRVTLSWKEGVQCNVKADSKDEALKIAQQHKFDDPGMFYEGHQALSHENWEVEVK